MFLVSSFGRIGWPISYLGVRHPLLAGLRFQEFLSILSFSLELEGSHCGFNKRFCLLPRDPIDSSIHEA